MKSGGLIVALAVAAALSLGALAVPAASDDAADKLAAPESFAGIADPAARSAALFVELGKVLTHPRCLNCHPSGDRPRQGDTAPTASAAGRARPGWVRPSGHALSDLPSGGELRARPRARQSDLASRAARDGMGRQDARRNLHADQRPRAQRQPDARSARRAYRRGSSGRLGVGARLRPQVRRPARRSRRAHSSRSG